MRKTEKTNIYSHCKQGVYDIDGVNMFFRSSWEAVYAKYLNLLIRFGVIEKWIYEKKTFWFMEIKRGVRSYTLDFQLIYKNGDIEYHEVKGWMDNRSKTKIKRMALYYPDIKLIVIGQKEYKNIKKKFGLKVSRIKTY